MIYSTPAYPTLLQEYKSSFNTLRTLLAETPEAVWVNPLMTRWMSEIAKPVKFKDGFFGLMVVEDENIPPGFFALRYPPREGELIGRFEFFKIVNKDKTTCAK